ncbi:phage holin family protein [Enterococcus sp. LJL90]
MGNNGEIFDFLEKITHDADDKVMYVLMLICIAMIIDFATGTLAAKINPEIEFTSKVGINGIIRKVASISLLFFFIPLAPLVPGGAGIGLIYVLYLGYLVMEIKSILENHKKMGNEITVFLEFIKKIWPK